MSISKQAAHKKGKHHWRILLIDDDEDDLVLIRQMLLEADEEKFSIEWASSLQAGENWLAADRSFDAVIVDYDLGCDCGMDLIRQAVSQHYPAPILLLTGRGRYDVDVQAMEAGAADYLNKSEINPAFLERAIRYAIERKKHELARSESEAHLRYSEAQLRKSEERYRTLFTTMLNGFALCEMIYDADGQPVDFRYLEINPAFEQLTGLTAQDVIGKTVREAIPGIEPYWIETYGKVALTGEPAQFENYVSAINKYYQVFAFRPQKNQFAALFIDITQRKQTEQALQKAHDQAIGLARFPDEDPNPVMRVNADGRVLYSNPAAKNNPGWECNDRQQVPDPLLPLIYEAMAKEEGTEQDVLLGDRCYSVSIMPFVKDKYVNLYGWDVTDRRQAENELRRSEVTLRESEAQLRQSTEALRESEQKFSLIFEKSAFAAVLTTFPEAILVSVNEAWENIVGYTRQEAIGKTSVELGINPDTGNRAQLIDQVIKNGTLHGIEMPLRTKAGERRVALLNIDVIAIGRERFFLNTMIDITERKQTEDALERALNEVENEKNRLLAIMEALPVGVVIVDVQGGIVQANQEYDRVWGGPYPTTLSVADYGPFKAWWVDTGEPVQPEEWASAQAVQKGEAVMGQLMEIRRFDGTHGIVLNSGAPIRDAQGQIVGCAVGIMDITEQKRLETEQREHHIQMEIQRRLLEYREQERQALARDLHDGPVQDLSSLLFNVQFAKEAITDPAIKVELDQIASRLKTTVQNLRETINEMRPPSLIRFGLSKAINVFLEEFQENHPDIDLDQSLMDDGSCLSEAARLGLYRILQEALTNIIKHSNAKRVAVVLSCDDHQTVLEIRDEGKGFSLSDNLVDYSVHGHYGLVGMKERADAIGGTLEINSLPQKGTAIRVFVPLA